jgi:hypothetical protein
MSAGTKAIPMSDISREALAKEIASLERQISALRELYALKYGEATETSRQGIHPARYANMKSWEALTKYLKDVGGKAEYQQAFDDLVAGGCAIKDTSNPPWSFRKTVYKGVEMGRFLLNEKTRLKVQAGPGDTISLPQED